jgi:ATP-binding cassette, subfamily B, bacterial
MAIAGGPAPRILMAHADRSRMQKLTPGTYRRVLPYIRRYRGQLVLLVLATSLDSLPTAVSPLIL